MVVLAVTLTFLRYPEWVIAQCPAPLNTLKLLIFVAVWIKHRSCIINCCSL